MVLMIEHRLNTNREIEENNNKLLLLSRLTAKSRFNDHTETY